ncbi:hypothetical protein CEUSTIGMA_g2580.t1 [Chlamydomonas eustigma]|uniref:LTD domain-containing protein n=1 Tax=Chlamydomonas eustigma TaxID=1157962 RepID=A0A250WWJ8_9CHLO|nr:hypothetical protein CEUSTIGMA_g2580.t1 [Chlamydomonas eustigma]|eukprot:GAX75136.1 hypothetical protein CEUSTIGMA_g2580.t1 [Chlamydomonas eustigma]
MAGPGNGIACDMIRWQAKVVFHNGSSVYAASVTSLAATRARSGGPIELETSSSPEAAESWCGTVIGPTNMEQSSDVPVLEWFTPFPEQAKTEAGSGQGSLYFAGRFYDNVSAHRRGQTSLSYPKPKLSFHLLEESFKYLPGRPPVKQFGLQSFWFELGERSYMKETLALQVLELAGVPCPTSFHVQVRQNGKFYGLFAFVEDVDDTFLQRQGLSTSGPLFKSVSGELSNLRYDLDTDQMHFYYSRGNRKQHLEDWDLLKNFTLGIAGDGSETRTKYLMDYVDIPEVINEMAAQTVVLNMDRCTKNFYVYLNPSTQQWMRFPWDLDASFGQDNGYGGKPGNDYCVLACEQWNSPLYCDSEHYQDLQRQTPWGMVAVNMDPGAYTGPTRTNTRRLRQRSLLPDGSGGKLHAVYPKPTGWADPDRNMTVTPSVTGVPGTFNYLTDAVLDISITRSMYMRRLRTLTDELLVSGKITKLANETYNRIKHLADLDAALWKSGIDVQRGFLQITTEFIPTRTTQLTVQYGPNGSYPLIPSSQSANASVYIRRGVLNLSEAEPYLELSNPSEDAAVDISGWSLTAGSIVAFTFKAGTVIPSNASIIVTPSLSGFRARLKSPKGGEGLLVVGPLILKAISLGGMSNATASSSGRAAGADLNDTTKMVQAADIKGILSLIAVDGRIVDTVNI